MTKVPSSWVEAARTFVIVLFCEFFLAGPVRAVAFKFKQTDLLFFWYFFLYEALQLWIWLHFLKISRKSPIESELIGHFGFLLF